MTRHDDRTRLRHMLDHAEEAASLARDHQRQDLETDRLLRHALTHIVEIVGEAATHVSKDLRDRHAEIPWEQIVGLRNRLIHGYDKVDLDVLWQIAQTDLPPLIVALRSVLAAEA